MKKIIEALVLFVLIIGGFTIYYFYKETNGFSKKYDNIEIYVNDILIDNESSKNVLYVKNTYTFLIVDKLNNEIEYDVDVKVKNNFKYKIKESYYSFSQIEDLKPYFSIEKYADSFDIKALKSIPEIVSSEEKTNKNSIEFLDYSETVDYLCLEIKIQTKIYTYAFQIKELIQ